MSLRDEKFLEVTVMRVILKHCGGGEEEGKLEDRKKAMRWNKNELLRASLKSLKLVRHRFLHTWVINQVFLRVGRSQVFRSELDRKWVVGSVMTTETAEGR